MGNQFQTPWTDKDTDVLMKLYQDGLSYREIGNRIGRSKDAVTHKINDLRKGGVITGKNRRLQKCVGDCDHCPFPDCMATDAYCFRIQSKQNRERFDKLPDCDKRAVRWQIDHGIRNSIQGKRKEYA